MNQADFGRTVSRAAAADYCMANQAAECYCTVMFDHPKRCHTCHNRWHSCTNSMSRPLRYAFVPYRIDGNCLGMRCDVDSDTAMDRASCSHLACIRSAAFDTYHDWRRPLAVRPILCRNCVYHLDRTIAAVNQRPTDISLCSW